MQRTRDQLLEAYPLKAGQQWRWARGRAAETATSLLGGFTRPHRAAVQQVTEQLIWCEDFPSTPQRKNAFQIYQDITAVAQCISSFRLREGGTRASSRATLGINPVPSPGGQPRGPVKLPAAGCPGALYTRGHRPDEVGGVAPLFGAGVPRPQAT